MWLLPKAIKFLGLLPASPSVFLRNPLPLLLAGTKHCLGTASAVTSLSMAGLPRSLPML